MLVLALAAGAQAPALGASTPTTASPSAPALKPPRVFTGSVEALTASSATLKGKVDPEGSASTYYFQYGPTAAYGSQTPTVPAGGGTQETPVTQAVAGLVPYTTYHFRIVAASSAVGTVEGQDVTFTTKKVPLSLSLAPAPNPVVFGRPLSVSGTLSGTGNAGIEVLLQGNTFPYTHGFHDLTSAEPTDASGAFSFPVADLLASTQLRAVTVARPSVLSPIVTEVVTVRVTLNVRRARRHGFVRLYGTVTPSEPGASVAFELMTRAHRYVAISGTVVHGAGGVSSFARTVRLRRRGLYRALVPVAAGAQISGRSRPVLIR